MPLYGAGAEQPRTANHVNARWATVRALYTSKWRKDLRRSGPSHGNGGKGVRARGRGGPGGPQWCDAGPCAAAIGRHNLTRGRAARRRDGGASSWAMNFAALDALR